MVKRGADAGGAIATRENFSALGIVYGKHKPAPRVRPQDTIRANHTRLTHPERSARVSLSASRRGYAFRVGSDALRRL
eukprot:scaffold121991_cov30-Tisochrysis_lutea.AAC.1